MSNEVVPGLGLVPLIVPGAALLAAVHLVYARRSRLHEPDSLRTLLTIAGWLMICLSVAGGLFAFTGVVSLLFALAVLVVCVMALRRFFTAERRSLLATLTVAIERRIPLNEAARAYAAERGSWLGRRAAWLAEELEAGRPLSLAIARVRLRLPSPIVLAIGMSEGKGDLPAALRQSAADLDRFDALLRPAVVRLVLMLVIVTFAVGVVTFQMIAIVPVFAQMYKEFELELPVATLVLVACAEAAIKHWWLAAPPIYGLLVPAVIVGLLYYVELLPRDLPLLGRFWRPVDRAATLRMLAWSVETRRPLAETVRQMAELHPRGYFRRMLARCSARIDQGGDWCDALREQRLIGGADAAVLRAAERAGNLPWALAETADAALRRTAYRLRAVIGMLFPIVVLLFGLFVAFVFVALFLPLVVLIERLA